MQSKWLPPFVGALLVSACQMAFSGTATVYYYTGWNPAYMHHNGSGTWTGTPGVKMDAACSNWTVKTIDFGAAANFQTVFTNGSGVWDNPSATPGANYVVGAGTHQIRNGQLLVNAGNPCGTGNQSVNVFYRPNTSWTTTNIHYSPTGGSWTTPPGVAMETACNGWRKKSIALGNATGLAATFNNGSGWWDNNAGKNYALGTGDVKVDNGVVSSGSPCVVGTPPTVPANFAGASSSPSTVNVSWKASTDDGSVTAYEIFIGTELKATVDASVTSYIATALSADTSYAFRVRAKDNDGMFSDFAGPLTIKTRPLESNTAEVYYYSTVWKTVNIHYSVTGSPWTVPPGVAMDAACANWSKKLINLGAAESVTVVFNDGNNVWDNNFGKNYLLPKGISTIKNGVATAVSKSPCVIDVNAPTPAPANLSGTVDGTTVQLSWSESIDDNGVVIYVVTRTGGNGSVTFESNKASFTDNTANPFTSYTYTVYAKDLAGNRTTTSGPVTLVTEAPPKVSADFSWDNATVYFLLTDRFQNGDTSNDRSYGRESDQQGRPFNNTLKDLPLAFHGGDLKGLTQKINEGYFTDLGINAIWFTAPYEQIHGFIEGDGRKHYGYHGYYALDFSAIDKNMGSKEDLKAMVDAAHAKGIRVVMDVVMNHAGYETLKDMSEFGFGGLNSGWESTAFRASDSVNYNTDIKPYLNIGDSKWSQWWGADWLRVSNGLAGYTACQGTDGLYGCTGYLPDFRTDNPSSVGLPPLLVNKWTKEGRLAAERASLDAWFAKTNRPRIVPNYIVKWLTDYVREFGIDGFRADTVKHVELQHWKTLKEEAQRARDEWLAANPSKAEMLKGDRKFWMTGEHWGHGTERSAYFDNGFDSMINFNFQGAAGNIGSIDSAYNTLVQVNANNAVNYNLLSYISSHDKSLFDRNNLKTGITTLLMAPGGVQVFYGDESKRPFVACCGDHTARGDMNWGALDTALLTHAQKLGKFRNAHVAVGAGSHQKLADAPYTFARIKGNDKVVVAFNASGAVQIPVGSAFAEGSKVRDAYTGQTASVTAGKVSLNADGVVLLEQLAQ